MSCTVSAVIVAAGASSRMGFDKLSYAWQGRTVLQRSVEAFDAHPDITELVLVAGPTNLPRVQEAAANCRKPARVVPGGQTRAQSVRNGVAVACGEILAIHDAARPFVSARIIHETVAAARRTGAAAPAVPVKDTVKFAQNGVVESTPPRDALYAVQTPQCFQRGLYLRALEQGRADLTDDCQLVEAIGATVALTQGDYANYKITTREDLPQGGDTKMQLRVGHGYDVHKLVEGRPLILGGVCIPFEKGLLGHSDADVLAHAVMDALLGAAALGDIGAHFPDTDPAYKGADSLGLMGCVHALLEEQGWQIQNVDATILCQAPKLAPYLPGMRANMAEVLGLAEAQISVKATTEEHLGFTGQGLGIAVHAVALLAR